MRKLVFIIFISIFSLFSNCFAQDNNLIDYDGIELRRGIFIPVISAQEISTNYFDIDTDVKFIAYTDLYIYDTIVIPKYTEFFGYIEKINEPVVGTNASMIIKVNKLRFQDGFEAPLSGYICVNNSPIIGGELTAPATYEKKPSNRLGFKTMVGYVPGATRKMGEHKVIASGAELILVLDKPFYVTHTVNN